MRLNDSECFIEKLTVWYVMTCGGSTGMLCVCVPNMLLTLSPIDFTVPESCAFSALDVYVVHLLNKFQFISDCSTTISTCFHVATEHLIRCFSFARCVNGIRKTNEKTEQRFGKKHVENFRN